MQSMQKQSKYCKINALHDSLLTKQSKHFIQLNIYDKGESNFKFTLNKLKLLYGIVDN